MPMSRRSVDGKYGATNVVMIDFFADRERPENAYSAYQDTKQGTALGSIIFSIMTGWLGFRGIPNRCSPDSPKSFPTNLLRLSLTY
jgi:hypothetical protein